VNTTTPATVQEHEPGGPLDGAIASFLKQLQTAGYAKESLRNKRTVVRTFADWLRRRHITVQAINESHVAAFLKRKPGTLPGRLKYKHAADGDVSEEHVQRREAVVARPRGVVSRGFEMVEKFAQKRHGEVVNAKGRRRSFECGLREAEQETKGIAVRRDRVGTGPELCDESISEESLEQRWKIRGGHCPPPARRPLSLSVASCSNSGIPAMYQ